MKSLRFQSCLLVSHREKRAREVLFHPSRTVIKGANDVGKSSLLKSIYQCFGADPAVEHPRWKTARISTLVCFTVDEVPYKIFRAAGNYGLFKGDELIGNYSSVTNQLGPALAELLGFHLRLANRDAKVVVPPPAYLFLPFYCDQDKGWGDTWSSFAKLSQFPNWRDEVVAYHSGVRSAAYYIALDASTAANQQLIEPRAEIAALIAIQDRSVSEISLDAEIDPQLFRQDVVELMAKQQEIADEKERFRVTLSSLGERRMQLTAQKEILTRVKSELHSDYLFAVESLSDDEVECPTCGQVHENSFSERFSIAQDEAKTTDLMAEIVAELNDVATRVRIEEENFDALTKVATGLQEILTRKRGDLTFHDYVARQGVKEFANQVAKRIQELGERIRVLELRATEAKEKMRSSESPMRRDSILENYRRTMEGFLLSLKVDSLSHKEYSKINFVVKETGSDRPRAILAYIGAMLNLIWAGENTPRCPIILDSPNQQDQDENNHVRMLEFIRDKFPKDSQIILGVVDDCGIDFGGDVELLTQKDFCLLEDNYEECAELLRYYEDMVFA